MEFTKGNEKYEEQDEENLLYDLLDARNLDSLAALDANVRDCAAPYLSSFEGYEEASGFRNAASMLGDAQLEHEADRDVYRCVGAMDFATQHQMGLGGEMGLDLPFELQSQTKSAKGSSMLVEPSPRLFSRVKLSHTHIYVACPLTKFVEMMNAELLKLEVDSMFEDSGCFWRGMYYPEEPSAAVDFRIYTNSVTSVAANRYLVEVVRRDGCAMVFNQLFASIRDKFLAAGMVTSENGNFVRSVDELSTPFDSADISWANKRATESDQSDASIPRLFLSRSVSSSSGSQTNETEEDYFDDDLGSLKCSDEDLFGPLYDMSKSNFEDVHVQGLSLVSHEVKKEGVALRLCKACPGIVQMLVERLSKSTHPEVRRHCCTALAAIAKETEMHAAIIAAGAVDALVAVAAAKYSAATGETQRQAAAGLANCCSEVESVKAVYDATKDKFEVFNQLAASCGDARLTQCIADVNSAIQAI